MTADPQPTPKSPARTWQEQVANIQRNLAAKTMSCDPEYVAKPAPAKTPEPTKGTK